MKLADWLFKEQLTPEQLRRMLGVKDRSSVPRYLSGKRVPRPAMLQRINNLTGGEVTLADFLDPSPPRCAEVVMDVNGEPQLVFPWTRGSEVQEAAFQKTRRAPCESERWSDPVVRATEVLGLRVKAARHGQFVLDGHVTDARGVVREANRVLKAFGRPEIKYPGVKGTDE